jgi:type II secretory pathway pseudopilin PulG
VEIIQIVVSIIVGILVPIVGYSFKRMLLQERRITSIEKDIEMAQNEQKQAKNDLCKSADSLYKVETSLAVLVERMTGIADIFEKTCEMTTKNTERTSNMLFDHEGRLKVLENDIRHKS